MSKHKRKPALTVHPRAKLRNVSPPLTEHNAAMPLLLALQTRLHQRTLTAFDYVLLSLVVGDIANGDDARLTFFADWPGTRSNIERELRRKTQRAASGTVMLKADEVAARVGLSKASMYRLARQGEFPKPVKLSKWASAWYAHEVEEWLRTRPRVKP